MHNDLVVYFDVTLVTGLAKTFRRLRILQFGSRSLSRLITPPPTQDISSTKATEKVKRGLLMASVCRANLAQMSATATSGVTVSKANLISDDMYSYLLASWNWILHISRTQLGIMHAVRRTFLCTNICYFKIYTVRLLSFRTGIIKEFA